MPPVNLVAYIFFYCRYKGRGFWYATIYQQQSSVRWNATSGLKVGWKWPPMGITKVAVWLGHPSVASSTGAWRLSVQQQILGWWCSERQTTWCFNLYSSSNCLACVSAISSFCFTHSDIPVYMIMILCIFIYSTHQYASCMLISFTASRGQTFVRIVNCHEVSKKMSTQTGASHGNCWESY